MKKNYLFFTALALCLPIFSHGDQARTDLTESTKKGANRLYFGPEFLGFQIDTSIKGVEIDSNRFFWGLRLGYEYLKPSSFYGAAELIATNTNYNFKFSDNQVTYSPNYGAGFGNLQARFGYTTGSDENLVTPFVALGVYALSKRSHTGFEESFGYVSVGARTRFELSRISAIGLNLEVLRTLGIKQTFVMGSEKISSRKNGWGTNIGIPFTVQLNRNWDLQITPYFLRILFGQSQNIYGTSLLFGYRF